MPGEVRVPELGESVVEVTIQRWVKSPGDTVRQGDTLVELETDKVNFELPAERDGVLQTIDRQEGETVKVGEVLGTIADMVVADAPAGPATTQPGEAGDNGHAGRPSEAVQAAPSARRLAAELNIDLTAVHGSGRGGLVTKDDVLAYVERPQAAAPQPQSAPPPRPAPQPVEAPVPAAAVQAPPDGRERRERMSRRRQTIARRLVEAQATAAMLTTFNEADLSAIMDVRRRRKEAFKDRHGVGLGFMSFFTKATVGALKEFPHLNAEIQGDEIVLKDHYDIGIAVGLKEGLVVPVLRDADRKSFAAIEQEITDLAARARDNTLSLADLQGGTFSITNGGIYGSLMSTPILNYPQAGILGMHAIKERAVVVGGEIVVRPMMYLALTYDHRIVDGSDAVRFLVRVKEMIEDPEALLLEG